MSIKQADGQIISNVQFTLSLISILGTVILTFCGYIYTHQKAIELNQRKDRLERINDQLRHVYGPLYSLSQTINNTWNVVIKYYEAKHNRVYGMNLENITEKDRTEKNLEIWRSWMKEVWMPQYLIMDQLIVRYSDLIDTESGEKGLPDILLKLSTHIAGYKAVLKNWETGNYKEYRSFFPYPRKELGKYAERNYLRLKKEQKRLLGYLNKTPELISFKAF